MQKIAQRGLAELESRSTNSRLEKLSWEDLKLFLCCADQNSFSDAARTLGLNISSVSRRIDRLEFLMKASLFHRLPDGVVLTAEGEAIAHKARLMHMAFCDLERSSAALNEIERGDATIAVTEGLGSYWVMPRLVEFQRDYPATAINLYCAMESVDVLRLEADMAIQFIKPTNPDLITGKLGRMHIYPFASQSYLDTYGTPLSVADMVHHRVVEQVAPQIDNSALARYLGLKSTKEIAGIRTNNSTAHLYAIEKGAGIGGLPTYAYALGAPVVPVDLGKGFSIDIWLTYHPDIKRSAHKMRAVNWIKAIFDPVSHPWFRDTFIHPRDLPALVPDQAAINDGRGYRAVTPAARSTLLRSRSTSTVVAT